MSIVIPDDERQTVCLVNRVWAMPNKFTFRVRPIAVLLQEEISGDSWADPFAGETSPAHFTNDADENRPTISHEDGLAFRADRLRVLGNGVIPSVAAKAFLHLGRRL